MDMRKTGKWLTEIHSDQQNPFNDSVVRAILSGIDKFMIAACVAAMLVDFVVLCYFAYHMLAEDI